MTTLHAPPERITLYYKEGNSDKIYSCAVEPSGAGFVVTFAYGRRGSTLQTGTKTAAPVAHAAAQKIFAKLVQEKTAKGYTPGQDGTPYQQTVLAQRATGILPQLLNPLADEEAAKLLADPAWLTQEKLDGRRILIQRRGDDIIGINRKGLQIALPELIVQCARTISGPQWLLDGECIGDRHIAFDLLEQAGVDLRPQPYRKRLDALYRMALSGPDQPISFVRTATMTLDKRVMLAELRRQNKEGMVFKRLAAPYTPGRPASGGDQLKLKFTATASCLVAKTNGSKRSVALELLDGGRRVSVGNITIPAGAGIPAVGSIIEAKYLYAYPGGSLYQPVYLGVRDDLTVEACTLTQLKYKAAEDDDA
ncbi:MAG: WGR domain-containing protein [Phycisphaerae bacterium]